MRVLRANVLVGVAVLTFGAMAVFAGSGDTEFRSAGSRQNTILKDSCPAEEFPPIQLGWASVIGNRPIGTTTSIRCVTEVRNSGEPVRGVPIMLGGELLTADEGVPVGSLSTRTGTTNRAGQKRFTYPFTPPPPGEQLAVVMQGLLEGDDEIDSVDTTCSIIQREPCSNSKTQACLSGKRFKVEVEWRDFSGGPDAGQLIKASKREALFYFFSPGSTDLIVELLQRCTANDHFWVFAAATTDVAFDLTVTDTFSGESRAYSNPLGRSFEPILDTAAFATCP